MSDFHHARLDWDDQGQPLSREFDDVYFSPTSGIDETHHVFINGNDLTRRFGELPAGGRFCIGETGFGTGLNFLCAWQLFVQHAPADARLHFVSVEKFPLSRDDIQRALALWPQLAPLTAEFIGQYVAVHPGFQRFSLDNGRVVLTLLVGDAMDCLPELDARIDAWFLDGFAPAKNPEMWSPTLFAQLARLSGPGTTLATFTSAGFVRRALKEAGFAIKRTPGFGKKWEMSQGHFEGQACLDASKPWFARPRFVPERREALVVGAGLAGCASAASLAARGWQVTLLERHDAPAREASGNPQGVLYLKLSAHGTPLSRLILSGFGHTRRLLQRLEQGRDWQACGVLQLAFDDKEAQRQAKLAEAFPADLLHSLDRSEAEALSGVALPAGGLFYPDAGWVHPPALCQLLAGHPNIHLVSHAEALELRQEAGRWHARAGDVTLASAPVVVLAGAAEVLRFPQASGLALKRIRGQISRLPATAESAGLGTVLCAEGYVAPPRDGEHTLGASFDFHSTDITPTAAEHAGNLELLDEISPDLGRRLRVAELEPARLEGRAAFRCTTPDYLPIVGPLADAQAFAETYAVLAKDARQVPDVAAPWLDGLYVNSAHGSRGLITAPLSGELLAAWLDDEPLPVPRAVAEACHPNRFALRRLIRGRSA
ncbi:bifunctional tRNA (5-methylaminomethyl-2-thiouridine)(34)-methyltransferase MnmD/FAD-dependent 5-carboxymethylaminomethyl-2-thiouridine(34) oxidoreductase MnmC [Pseudomonas taiwanensis]|uniref:bifunctional tRNA (5-methylaminomethyl-2-thiouridine)(34)-methyltransferase MnmD/FAD-dependent 5-carboxymethylaminomethyl-2-thiouridine(34) oxidoreductase MnmC n=1 Tax=Pseudomonas taiwanensis TaxID=470150 RepID=UPI0015C01676|nr:bifunctional tRNA (5-methylaminomethyl-2-thiouridine)(34)-methyltransferase MnmD/FAD-dependent 5-carboxymethylaminomethyl-2-thiouridine(34) oxidoreductase MnmC [Pseudomonas taiwanensis]NWL80473.1 bifunctional tRNA (5-methylaminomethyl-2-thiouridine)(34)-methyltransferase MnmD/FAD-dependent 5-carboxymethylaminomethyl-2-thiouridine(34) oxidoreductase MnmC [Pseudomonas taiwanensis]